MSIIMQLPLESRYYCRNFRVKCGRHRHSRKSANRVADGVAWLVLWNQVERSCFFETTWSTKVCEWISLFLVVICASKWWRRLHQLMKDSKSSVSHMLPCDGSTTRKGRPPLRPLPARTPPPLSLDNFECSRHGCATQDVGTSMSCRNPVKLEEPHVRQLSVDLAPLGGLSTSPESLESQLQPGKKKLHTTAVKTLLLSFFRCLRLYGMCLSFRK